MRKSLAPVSEAPNEWAISSMWSKTSIGQQLDNKKPRTPGIERLANATHPPDWWPLDNAWTIADSHPR